MRHLNKLPIYARSRPNWACSISAGGTEGTGEAGAAGAGTAPNSADLGADSLAGAAGDDALNGGDAPDAAAQALEAARAVTPEAADGYVFNVSEAAKGALGKLDGDPVVAELQAFALERKMTQGQFDDSVGAIVDRLALKGFLLPNFDPAAELQKLGDNGSQRRGEVETFASQLLDRKEIDAEQAAELTSLSATAAGVKLVESLRKMMGAGAGLIAPGPGDAGAGADADKARAAEMRRDPKYGVDAVFTREADELRQRTYGKK